MNVCVLCLFLMMPWIGLLAVIVAFPGRSHLLTFWFGPSSTTILCVSDL